MNRPEFYIMNDGTQEWWKNGLRHRENGPAILYPDGGEEWWFNGQLHRQDGPAVITADGEKSWWVHGVFQAYCPEPEPDEISAPHA